MIGLMAPLILAVLTLTLTCYAETTDEETLRDPVTGVILTNDEPFETENNRIDHEKLKQAKWLERFLKIYAKDKSRFSYFMEKLNEGVDVGENILPPGLSQKMKLKKKGGKKKNR